MIEDWKGEHLIPVGPRMRDRIYSSRAAAPPKADLRACAERIMELASQGMTVIEVCRHTGLEYNFVRRLARIRNISFRQKEKMEP